MGKRAHSSEETLVREPLSVRKYLGFEFIEYPDGYDFRMGRKSSSLTKILSTFTLLVIGAMVAVGLLFHVHVKVPVSGQMAPKEPLFVVSKIKGKVTVKVKSKEGVEEGQILVEVSPTEQELGIHKMEQQLDQAKKNVENARQQAAQEEARKATAETRLAQAQQSKTNRERELEEHNQRTGLSLAEFDQRLSLADRAVEQAKIEITNNENEITGHRADMVTKLAQSDQDIQRAELDVADKKTEYDRNVRLGTAISQSDLEKSRNAWEIAKTNLSTATTKKQELENQLANRLRELELKLERGRLTLATQEGEKQKVDLEKRTFQAERQSGAYKIQDEVQSAILQIETGQKEVEVAVKSIEIAGNNLNIAQGQVSTAEADVTKAKADLEEGKEVRSPCAGSVEELMVQTGQEVTPGQPLLKIGKEDLEFVGLIESRYKDRVEAALRLAQDEGGDPPKVSLKFDEFQKGGSEDIEHTGTVERVTEEFVTQGTKKVWIVKIKVGQPKSDSHRGIMPRNGYAATGNILTQRMPLLKYWVLHKVLKKV